MRWLSILLALWALPVHAQLPDHGVYQYQIFDKNDHPVGTHHFTIDKVDQLWQIKSETEVDTRIYFLKIKIQDSDSFTSDGSRILAFSASFKHEIPLQKKIEKTVSGRLEKGQWLITSPNDVILPAQNFDEFRHLITRVLSPSRVVHPGESRRMRSLNLLTLEIDAVESRGIGEESVEFQGESRKVYVMEQKLPDGVATLRKFANGLIYRSQSANGYTLLQSAKENP